MSLNSEPAFPGALPVDFSLFLIGQNRAPCLSLQGWLKMEQGCAVALARQCLLTHLREMGTGSTLLLEVAMGV